MRFLIFTLQVWSLKLEAVDLPLMEATNTLQYQLGLESLTGHVAYSLHFLFNLSKNVITDKRLLERDGESNPS